MKLGPEQKPSWGKVSGTAKAHLLMDSHQAWCGLDSEHGFMAAPYDTRCKRCVLSVQNYLEEAVVAPATAVTETWTVTVTKPAGSQEFNEVLAYVFKNRTTWKLVATKDQSLTS